MTPEDHLFVAFENGEGRDEKAPKSSAHGIPEPPPLPNFGHPLCIETKKTEVGTIN